MKKKITVKSIGTLLTVIFAVSSFAVVATSFSTSASETQPGIEANSTTVTEEATAPTIDKEPGIYPIDADHYLRVYPDHTFRVVSRGDPDFDPT